MIKKLINGVDPNYIEHISFSIDTVEQEMLNYIKETANAISARMYRVLEQSRQPKSKEQER